MPTSFRPYLPNQGMPLPADLRKWVPEDHLARQVGDLVESLDLSAFYSPYEGDGRRNAPYEPAMMVKILIYAYATGTFSSRKISRKVEEDIAFRMLVAGKSPSTARSANSDAATWTTSAPCSSRWSGWSGWPGRWAWRASAPCLSTGPRSGPTPASARP